MPSFTPNGGCFTRTFLPTNLRPNAASCFLGSGLTDELLRLVPNVQVFRYYLRCVKLWAQRALSFPSFFTPATQVYRFQGKP